MIGRVYKVIHCESNACYIGSTINDLRFRWQSHKNGYHKWVAGEGRYVSLYNLFEKHGFANFKIIKIKDYEVVDRAHLRVWEQFWINRFKKDCCNENNAITWVPLAKLLNKAQSRKYKAENKEQVSESNRLYYQKNKETYQAKAKEKLQIKTQCECGGRYSEASKYLHFKSIKHQKFVDPNSTPSTPSYQKYTPELYEKKKDSIKAASKRYYEKNKEALRKKYREAAKAKRQKAKEEAKTNEEAN